MVISAPTHLASLPVSLWKNGGGSTRTLAVEPAKADLDHFLWRISLAEVSAAGSFSRFSGVDRTILLWSGAGLVLRAPEWSHTLDQRFIAFDFQGEEDLKCGLVDGPTIDLNVMVRRGVTKATVQVVHDVVTISEPAEVMFLICAEGELQIRSNGHADTLVKTNEFVRIDECEAGTRFVPSGDGATFLSISLVAA